MKTMSDLCGDSYLVYVIRAGVPNLSLTMYPFSILRGEHVPLQHFNK